MSQNYQPASAVLKMSIVILCFTVKLDGSFKDLYSRLEDVEFAGNFLGGGFRSATRSSDAHKSYSVTARR